MAKRVSVIVRTRNEETWIDHCLNMLFKQDYPDFEVVVVDNKSTDHTLEIVRRYPVAALVEIENYLPGLSLNEGIRRSTGDYLAFISAHCIPQRPDWLSMLVQGFEVEDKIAGVYGRQLPLAFSREYDKRDLLTTFGLDRRVQVKDYFFHNANSMVRREMWEKFPFDEAATNIEDRLWGKAVTEAGWRLLYEPEAAVYHHHGINQGGDPTRAMGVSSMLDKLETDIVADLPHSLRPENTNVVAVVPVLGEPRELQGADLFGELLRQMGQSRYVRTVYAIGESDKVRKACDKHGIHYIERPETLQSRERTLGDALRYALQQIEARDDFPQTILYANYLCPFRPAGLFDELVTELHYKGLDSVFAGYVDYNDHWLCPHAGVYERVSESLRPGPERPRLYRSLYGVGCATRSTAIRRGQLVGDKVGIVPVDEHIYTLRCTDERPLPGEATHEDTSLIGWTAQLFLKEFRP
ncbi:MAG: glycosyltransferase [Actinomycetota bacterium]